MKTNFGLSSFDSPADVHSIVSLLLRIIRHSAKVGLKSVSILLFILLPLFTNCQQSLSAGGPGTGTEVVGCIKTSNNEAAPDLHLVLSRYSSKVLWYTDRHYASTNTKGEFKFDDIDTGIYLLDATDYKGHRLILKVNVNVDPLSRQLGVYYIEKTGAVKGYLLDNTDTIIETNAWLVIYKDIFPICSLPTFNEFIADSLPPGLLRFKIQGQILRSDNVYRLPVDVTLLDSTIMVSSNESVIIDTINFNDAAIRSNDSSLAELSMIKSFLIAAGSTQDVSASWFHPITGHLRTIDIQSTNGMLMSDAIRTIAAFPGIETLRLSGFGGEAIPETLFTFKQLSELSLTDGEISDIPERIADLKNLRSLHFVNNKIKTLPDCILNRSIPHLEYIDFTGNPLRRIEWDQQLQINSLYFDGISILLTGKPFAINERDYRALLTLFDKNNLNDRMVHTYITTGSGLNDQDAVVTITINDATISILPEEINDLIYLRSLHIFKNSIDTLPEVFGSLSRLESLHITNGTISALPTQMGRCTNLKTIDFTNNAIHHLPKWLGLLGPLKCADFSNNCIDTTNTVIPSTCIVDQMQCSSSSPAPDSLYRQDTSIVSFIINFNQTADLPLMDYIQCQNNRVVLLRMVLNDHVRLTSFDTLCAMALKLDSLKTLHLLVSDTTAMLPVTSKIFPSLDGFIGTGGDLQFIDQSFSISFPALKNVAFAGNRFSSIPDPLKSLISLTSVDLYFNHLTDLSNQDSLWLSLRSIQDRRVLWDSNFGYRYSHGLYWRDSQFSH
jgi:Leucine-rich repeat (LRR) protein